MKKSVTLLAYLVGIGMVFGQNSAVVGEAQEAYTTTDKVLHKPVERAESGAATTFWSEDFANGIPSTWSQAGSPAAAVWEYRGPNTNPDLNTGSQGAFAGTGGGGPLLSPTGNNGFVIFDSDFYDNGGNPAGLGTGSIPAPHVGVLQTDTIDLSSRNFVEVAMFARIRNFDSRYLVAVSNDGGATFTDTVELISLPTNSPHVSGELSADITASAANQSDVVLQFIYDGSGSGYYYWAFDDVELRELPLHDMRYTEFTDATGTAPEKDLVVGVSGQPKYGNQVLGQLRPVGGNANIYNYGSATQTNVKVEMEIWDASTLTMVQTLSTPVIPSLAYGDTLDNTQLTFTSQWTPPSTPGDYLLVWKATSDSIGPNAPGVEATDTFSYSVNQEIFGLDDGQLDNTVGTGSLANGTVIGVVGQYDIDNSDPSLNNAVRATGAQIYISSISDTAADLEIQIWDTVGFFGAAATPLYSELFQLNGNLVGTLVDFNFSQTVDLPAPGSYYLKVNFFPTGTNEVRVGNSQTWGQGVATFMQADDGRYFAGFSNSKAFESPIMRLRLQNNVSLSETSVDNAFIAFPNPTDGVLNMRAGVSGNYTLNIINMVGQVVRTEQLNITAGQLATTNLSDLQAGVYLLSVEGEGLRETIKLTLK